MSHPYPTRLHRPAPGLLPLLLLLLTGCKAPALLVWSPDGSKAGYYVETHGFVVDQRGKVLADLNMVGHGFAWSSDSSTLYFAAVREADATTPADPPAAVDWGWLDPAARPAPAAAPAPADGTAEEKKATQSLKRWRNGEAAAVCGLPTEFVANLCLSPDGQWVALVALQSGKGDEKDALVVYACALKSGRVYAVARPAGYGLCFTGPHRLAFIETTRDENGQATTAGRVVEVDLADAPAAPKRQPLPAAVPSTAVWLGPAGGDGDLLVSYAVLPPGETRWKGGGDVPFTLARYSRRDSSVKTVAEGTDGWFAADPAGGKVVYVAVTPAKGGAAERRALAVVNADGTGRRELRNLKWTADGTDHYEQAMWPAWQGNDRLYLATPDNPAQSVALDGNKKVVYFDVGRFDLAADGLRPAGKFGDGWPREMQPRVEFQTEQTPAAPPAGGK